MTNFSSTAAHLNPGQQQLFIIDIFRLVGLLLLIPASTRLLIGLFFIFWMPLTLIFGFFVVINGMCCLYWLTFVLPLAPERKLPRYIIYSLVAFVIVYLYVFIAYDLAYHQIGPVVFIPIAILCHVLFFKRYAETLQAFRTELKARQKNSNYFDKILRFLIRIWLCVAGILVVVAIVGCYIGNGMLAVEALFAPNNYVNWTLAFIVMSPALLYVLRTHYVALTLKCKT